MSRNGRIPISIPENTQVRIDNGIIFAKGKLGELSFAFKNDAKVELSDNSVVVQKGCLLYTSPSPRDKRQSRMPSSA